MPHRKMESFMIYCIYNVLKRCVVRVYTTKEECERHIGPRPKKDGNVIRTYPDLKPIE